MISKRPSANHALIAGALATVLALGACGQSDSVGAPDSTPVGAVTAFIHAIESGDCATVQSLVLDGDSMDCTTVRESAGSLADDGIDIDAVKVGPATTTGDSAVVDVDWSNGTPKEQFELQSVDGTWLVSLDTGA
jgi:hypothetical protein